MRSRINGTAWTDAGKKLIEPLKGAPQQVFSFPWPPTANKYWRHERGRHHISEKGVIYRRHVGTELMVSGYKPFGSDRILIHIEAHPPDKRRRDLDNLHKALLDSLQYAGLFDDDSQIDSLHIIRAEVAPLGYVRVGVRTMDGLHA